MKTSIRYCLATLLVAGDLFICAKAGAANCVLDTTTFTPSGLGNGAIYATAMQNDGKLIVAGSFTSINGSSRLRVARLNSNGSLDSAFVPHVNDGAVLAVAVQRISGEDRILIGGSFTSIGTCDETCPGVFFISRLGTNGTIDNTFSTIGLDNSVRAITLQPDGKILIAGDFSDATSVIRIARLLQDGGIDTNFVAGGTSTSGFDGSVCALSLQSDGKIIAGGDFTHVGSTSRQRIARLSTNGIVDVNFSAGSRFGNSINAVLAQSSGKILVGSTRLVRLQSDGTLDGNAQDFDWDVQRNGGGGTIMALGLDGSGRIIVGGKFDVIFGWVRYGLARITQGSTFTIDAWSDCSGIPSGTSINALLVTTSDDSSRIGGDFATFEGTTRNGIARVTE